MQLETLDRMALVRYAALSLMVLASPALAQTPAPAAKPEPLPPIGAKPAAPPLKTEPKPAAEAAKAEAKPAAAPAKVEAKGAPAPATAKTEAKPAATAEKKPETKPAAPAAKAEDKPPVVQAAKVDDWPVGAPRGEYEFTAWCYGVLKRHMELYDEVRPELDAISKRWNTVEEDNKSYGEQLAAGRGHLNTFAKAIETAEKASARPINSQGAAAAEQGRRMWNEFKTVEPLWQAYSWMNWALPERCVTTAAALEEKSLLMSPALKANLKAEAPAAKPAAAKTEAVDKTTSEEAPADKPSAKAGLR